MEGLRVNQRVAPNPRTAENKLEESISPGVHNKSIEPGELAALQSPSWESDQSSV